MSRAAQFQKTVVDQSWSRCRDPGYDARVTTHTVMNQSPTATDLQPDGPPPLDGTVRRVWHYAVTLRDPIKAVRRRFARYGDVYRVRSDGGALYVIKHPDHIRDVLLTHGASFGKRHSAFLRLREVLGDGLLTSEGETWRRQRRLVQPAFARPRLSEYAQVMAEEALVTARALGRRAGVVQLSRELTALTLRIVARTLFSQRIDDSPRVGRAMLLLNRAFSRPDVLPAYLPTPGRIRLQRALADLDAAVSRSLTGAGPSSRAHRPSKRARTTCCNACSTRAMKKATAKG